jgi:hypothetical protein
VAPPNVADIVITVDDVTAFVVTTNPAVVAPAGTVTLAGTPATVVLLLDRVTTAPPAGAAALSMTVPVDVLPPRTLVGCRLSDVSIGVPGVTVSCADRVAPPPAPEIVTAVDVVTTLVATANVAVVPPAATVIPAGTVAAAVLLLDRVTTAPPAGAAALSVTAPVDVLPPRTLIGVRLSDVSVGVAGVTVSCADRVAKPPLPEIVTAVAVGTELVATTKVAVVLPAGTVKLPGTVATAMLLLDRVTIAPPAGAATLSVTVPVDVPPPPTLVGRRLIDIRSGIPGVVQVTPPSVLCSAPDAVAA